MPQNPDDHLLDTREAAALLGYQPRTLEGLRYRGGGPPYIRLTARAIRYRRSDIDRWLAERVRTSTSEI